MKPATISLAAYRAMLEEILAYVPMAARENARAAATAIGVGYEPKPQRKHRVKTTQAR